MQPRSMPRREGLPLYNFGVGLNVASCGYQQRRKTKVDRHRIAYLLSAYQRGLRMQFFAMTIYICREFREFREISVLLDTPP